MNIETVILYRPVGPKELELIQATGNRAFPPRLPEQPIFYPVLNEEYANDISRKWNVRDYGAGYVTRFQVRKEFAAKYPVQIVGDSTCKELWVPAEELPDFNANIVGQIEVIAEFKREGAHPSQSPRKVNWLIKQKNILDEPADALICSANVNLLLTGGVGADLLARYGKAMQDALQAKVQTRHPHCVQRGEIIPYFGTEMPYQMVLNAVGVNGWYESSPEIITDLVGRSLKMAAEKGAKKIALTALATGFGRLSLAEFAQGIRPLLQESMAPIEEVAELARHLPDANTNND